MAICNKIYLVGNKPAMTWHHNTLLTAAHRAARQRHPDARVICDLLMALCGTTRDGRRPWLRLVANAAPTNADGRN